MFYRETKPQEVVVKFSLPNGNQLEVTAVQPLTNGRCPLHPDYPGDKEPTNNCNGCWEFLSQQRRHIR